MKTTSLIHLVTVLAALIAGLSLLPQIVQAQDNLYPEDVYSQEELAQMLAPIALYPDALLSQVLMASGVGEAGSVQHYEGKESRNNQARIRR